MISKPSDYLVEWRGNEDGTERDGVGWIVHVDISLPSYAIHRLSEYAKQRFVEMWRGLPHGDQKEFLGRAIKLLDSDRITQKFPESGVGVFQSTEKVTTTSYFI